MHICMRICQISRGWGGNGVFLKFCVSDLGASLMAGMGTQTRTIVLFS